MKAVARRPTRGVVSHISALLTLTELVSLGVFLNPVIAFAAPEGRRPSSIAEARQAVSASLSALSSAVDRASRDPPAESDLEAVSAALDGLKAAIDAGSQFEAKDLDYAKLALSARKELRTQRQSIEERRAKIALHQSWRRIEAARAKLDAAVARLSGKTPSAQEFEDAKKAAADLERELGIAAPLVSQDPKFARFVGEAKTGLAERQKTVEDRGIALAVETQTRSLEEARRKLAAAMSAIKGKQPSDVDFERAGAAADALSKVLDAERALETKDKGYRARADETREELKRSTSEIETVFGEAGLNRLKSEMEPARAELVNAAAAFRGGKVTEDQVAEARTAVIVVDKLLEKSQRVASRSRVFREYARDVRKTLVEVEVALHRRDVVATRNDVTSASKKIQDREVTESDFVVLATAIAAARDVLARGERLEKEDRGYGALANEAKRVLREAETAARARKGMIEALRQRATLAKAGADVTNALRALRASRPPDEVFDEAKTAIIVLEKTIEETQAKDASVVATKSELRSLLKNARTTMDARRIEVDVAAQKTRVEEARKEIAALLARIAGRSATDDDLASVDAAIERGKATLAAGAALVKKDRAYATYDREVRKRFEEAMARANTRRNELAVARTRSTLEDRLRSALASLAAAQQPEATDKDVGAASRDVEDLRKVLSEGANLERIDRGYGAFAAKLRKDLERLVSDVAFAERARVLRLALVPPLSQGDSLIDRGERAGDTRSQRSSYEGAVSSLKACASAEEQALEENAKLATIDVLVNGERMRPKDVVALCRERLGVAEAALKRVVGLIAFEEGPKRSFVAGKKLLRSASEAQGEKARELREKALSLFEECISSGKILEYSNPELKDREFDVDGRRLALGALVSECTTEGRRLRTK